LVEPLGFRIDEHAVRRAGLDYWHLVEVHTYPNIEALAATLLADGQRRAWYFSAHASRSYVEVELKLGDVLVFGKESTGLPASLLEEHADETLGIPTLGGVRSLNLANCVALGVYEGLRQQGLLGGAALTSD
jgi:tRNA (cytidine/uridine-2'-O-)-methyltransferase